MNAAGQTLLQFGRDSRYLGGKAGVTMVLHTWTSCLEYHPHAHCLVPAGGIDGLIWRNARQGYLFPVRAMSKVFRGVFLKMAREALPEVQFPSEALSRDWVVFAKPAPKNVDRLIGYLGRYVHRVALSNSRIISMAGGKVSFSWKDSRDSKKKTTVLPVFEFMRRYLQHVLPSRFHKVRYFGFMSPSNRRRFRRIRLLLWMKAGYAFPMKEELPKGFLCRICEKGTLVKIGAFFPSSRSPP